MIRIHNFKSFLNFELELSKRHLVIGKNNSGKSNLCFALRFLGATSVADYNAALGQVPGGFEAFCHRSSKSPSTRFGCACELPYEKGSLRFHYDLQLGVEKTTRVPGPAQWSLRTAEERLVVDGPGWPRVELLVSDGKEVRLLHEERYLKAPSGSDNWVSTRAPWSGKRGRDSPTRPIRCWSAACATVTSSTG
jgi:predicted ATPase